MLRRMVELLKLHTQFANETRCCLLSCWLDKDMPLLLFGFKAHSIRRPTLK